MIDSGNITSIGEWVPTSICRASPFLAWNLNRPLASLIATRLDREAVGNMYLGVPRSRFLRVDPLATHTVSPEICPSISPDYRSNLLKAHRVCRPSVAERSPLPAPPSSVLACLPYPSPHVQLILLTALDLVQPLQQFLPHKSLSTCRYSSANHSINHVQKGS